VRRKRRKGAASAAPTSITGVRGLAHNPAILNWVRELTRRGLSSKQIVTASVEGANDWPVPGYHLSDGSLAACRAAIYHLEIHNVSFPLPLDGKKKPKSETGGRLRELYAQRKVKDNLLINARIDISKMVQHLEIIDFMEYGLRDADPETTADIYNELTILAAWVDTSLSVVAHEIDDLRKVELIRKLRNTAGRSPEEARAFLRAADRLEAERLQLAN
jgi:hypothetical protein